MSSLDLNKLMLEYSKKGIQDWNNGGHDLQEKSRQCLLNSIAEREDDVEKMINTPQTSRLFVPMPKVPDKAKGFEWCFFLPKINNGDLRSLILFLLVNRARRNCLAFRFEPSGKGPHGYPHMQFTRKTESSSALNFPGIPEWLPDSYPAFPVSAHNPLEMFLCMVTAVHGFHGRARSLKTD